MKTFTGDVVALNAKRHQIKLIHEGEWRAGSIRVAVQRAAKDGEQVWKRRYPGRRLESLMVYVTKGSLR